ncbi:MAG: choice-of-anchor tandem repeat NxxGxxAF-containing protein [Verrucomicrobiia bacterium]
MHAFNSHVLIPFVTRASFGAAALVVADGFSNALAASLMPVTTIVAVDGDPLSRGNASVKSAGVPVLHNSGGVYFSSGPATALVRGDAASRRHDVLLLQGDPSSDGNGKLDRLDHLRVNSRGQAACGSRSLAEAARQYPGLNDAGQVVFAAETFDPSSRQRSFGFFRADGPNLIPLVRRGEAVPDGNGSFLLRNGVAFNDRGGIAFSDVLVNSALRTGDNAGVFRIADTGAAQIVRKGASVPGGDGTFNVLGRWRR